MKLPLPFTIHDSRFTIGKKSSGDAVAARGVRNRQSSIANRKSAEGVALVITLIMLSVTLVMAVAFLAVARRERNAVSTTTDTATARLASDSALSAAQAQIAANIYASKNAGAYSFNLLVSTNYINAFGFVANSVNPTNVNYDYLSGGGAVLGANMEQNIANLLLLPRAPVYVYNRQTGLNDFRFYLDLNRNGRFDTNGVIAEFDNTGTATGNFGFHTGDPEWIGVLERPDQPHGPNNRFIARYAFLAQPIGNALDLNYIHNEALEPSGMANGFFRNQGAGSWELNLAGFLADLNTNTWGQVIGSPIYYQYNSILNSANSGRAFDDARALLDWRYNFNFNNLASANNSLANLFNYPNNIDLYSDGPLQTTVTNTVNFTPDNTSVSWAGGNNTAANPNRYYELPSEIFNPPGSGAAQNNFINRLGSAGNGNSTYDRYTFYRMLDQLGTDSSPERGKLNLNYSNAVVQYNADGAVTGVATMDGAETNLVPWTATNFFCAAADRMLRSYTTNWFAADPTNYLRTYYGINPPGYLDGTGMGVTNLQYFGQTNEIPAFGIGNIPVRWNGNFVYSPAVNRVLQFAANLYDASTNSFYPSVFRPIFEHDADKNIFIAGYTGLSSGNGPNTVRGANDPQLALPYDVSELTTTLSTTDFKPITDANGFVNVYGVPWIIGAKKNLPGLNQFSLVNSAQFTRKLQVGRQFIGGPLWTNQLVVMSVSNNMGVSFWNSYSNNYNNGGPLNLSIVVNSKVEIVVTNSDWGNTVASYVFATNYVFAPTSWPGSKWLNKGAGSPAPNSFITANWANQVVPDAAYNFTTKSFNLLSITPNPWDINRTELDPLPQFGLLTTNWLRTFIVDGTHVIDYVQLRGPIDGDRMNNALSDPNYADATGNRYLWSTNIFGSGTVPSWGIENQIEISSRPELPPVSLPWKPGATIPGLDPITASRVFFGAVLTPNSVFNGTVKDANGAYVNVIYTNTQLIVQAPYTATRTVYVPYLYQVNDPLVHYTANDLNAGDAGVWAGNYSHKNGVWDKSDYSATTPIPTPPTTEIVKGRYQPWGKVAPTTLQAGGANGYNFGNPCNLIYKDPLVWGSDYWDFPTNHYPTAGWIGRVHRGTPWQTAYLKANNVLHASTGASGTNTWKAWTGDYTGNGFDAANSAPIRDRVLFDVFTTAPNDNASRGQLSVNVGANSSDPAAGMAAWSAVFSGMVALSNNVPNNRVTILPPSTTYRIIDPAGVNSVYSPLGIIVTNINYARSRFVNADGVSGVFEHKGDILSVAALTEQSPYLNLSTQSQVTNGISDEVYEWLPQQAMSLLSCPSGPRYVVYCYGQTLRPAPDGTVLTGDLFNLVTNYQVTAESAARAVIRLEQRVTAAGTNYSTVVESYNVLGPN